LSTEGSTDFLMRYPGNPAVWGTVFLTFGPAVDANRPGYDMSAFQTLALEINGDPGTLVDVGIKDSTQPDNGTESKVSVSLTGGWQTVQIPLNSFIGVDLRRVYVLTEFVFNGSQAQTIRVRSISYTSAPATFTNVLPQFAFGGGWYSALYFTNIGGIPAVIQVNFVTDNGKPLSVPTVGGSAATLALAPGGTAMIEAPNTGPLTQGYVSASLTSGILGYGVYRQSQQGIADQEAVVPLTGDSATICTLIWDDTNLDTAVAIVNPSALDTVVSITVRDISGQVIGASSISLSAKNKSSLYLRNLPGLGVMAGRRGSADFSVTSGTVAVLGVRFNGAAFTSIPAVSR
jgi:hypothetical protein